MHFNISDWMLKDKWGVGVSLHTVVANNVLDSLLTAKSKCVGPKTVFPGYDN